MMAGTLALRFRLCGPRTGSLHSGDLALPRGQRHLYGSSCTNLMEVACFKINVVLFDDLYALDSDKLDKMQVVEG
jgi:hypothetical protein